jgi:hypothetical protein
MNSKLLLLKIIFAILLVPQLLLSQYQLSGRLLADDAPLPYAEIVLTDTLEQFVKGTIADKDGFFTLLADPGTYSLKASFLGYASLERSLTLTADIKLGNLILNSATAELGTVTVTAQKLLIEQRTDRLIFNVENSVAAAGGTGLTALELAPGVRLQNGILELVGRGNPAVLLNGRLLQLSGEELTDFIRGLAADDIARVEVITNPPARYAAAGRGGLLNIVLKKGRSNAWKNAISVARTQAFYGATNVSNTFFYNHDRLSLSANVTARRGYQRDFEGITVDYPTSRWSTDMLNKSAMDRTGGRLTLDYQFNDRLSLGGQYQGSDSSPGFIGAGSTQVSGPGGTLDSLLINRQSAERSLTNHAANLHGKLLLDTLGRTVSVDLDYFDYDNDLEQGTDISTFAPNGDFTGLNLAQLNFSDQRIDNFSAKIDVEHPIGDLKLSYGASLTFTETFGDQRNFDTHTGRAISDPLLSNEFTYQENVQAVYLNASGKLGTLLDWQAGLRFENTDTESYSVTLDQRTLKSYAKLFPTFYLTYNPNEDNNYIFSYGRRINRPGFRNLNPFRIYVNSNSYSEGNPFLQPSFTDLFDFTHAWRGKLRTNFFFNRTIDGHGTLFSAEEDGLVQAVIRRNYFTEYYFGIGQIYTWEPATWWTSQNQAYLLAGITDVGEEFAAEGQNGLQLNLSSNHTFSFGNKTKLQVNAWYNLPHRANVFVISATYGLTLGLQQDVGKSLKFSLTANDVFDTASLRSLASVVNGVKTDYSQNYASRHLRLTASYQFGNQKIEVSDRGFGNEGVRRRM